MTESEQVHFRIEFSVDREPMDGNELPWDQFCAWLASEYNAGPGRPGAGALLADFAHRVHVSMRYRTETGGWDGVP